MNVNGTTRALPKAPVLVEVALTDGAVFHGYIFVHRQARLTDVLNDDRQFLPVQTADGKYLAISKSYIRQVTLSSSQPTAYKGSDPYKILGVQEGVSLEDLKRTYHELCLANHPDRIKGFGLSSEYQELGTKNTARINEAYGKVLKSLGQ